MVVYDSDSQQHLTDENNGDAAGADKSTQNVDAHKSSSSSSPMVKRCKKEPTRFSQVQRLLHEILQQRANHSTNMPSSTRVFVVFVVVISSVETCLQINVDLFALKGDRPFECKLCCIKFGHKFTMRAHMLSHDKAYTCFFLFETNMFTWTSNNAFWTHW